MFKESLAHHVHRGMQKLLKLRRIEDGLMMENIIKLRKLSILMDVFMKDKNGLMLII